MMKVLDKNKLNAVSAGLMGEVFTFLGALGSVFVTVPLCMRITETEFILLANDKALEGTVRQKVQLFSVAGAVLGDIGAVASGILAGGLVFGYVGYLLDELLGECKC